MNKKDYLNISNHEVTYHISPADISHILALGACSTTVTVKGDKITCSKNLSAMTKELNKLKTSIIFFRVHNSCLVNMYQVDHFEKKKRKIAMKNGEKITVSKRNKAEFSEKYDDL